MFVLEESPVYSPYSVYSRLLRQILSETGHAARIRGLYTRPIFVVEASAISRCGVALITLSPTDEVSVQGPPHYNIFKGTNYKCSSSEG